MEKLDEISGYDSLKCADIVAHSLPNVKYIIFNVPSVKNFTTFRHSEQPEQTPQ